MKLLVLGATGGTGREVVTEALAQGHEVTAFVRDPARLVNQDSRLRVVVGSLPDGRDKLGEAVRGQQAVLCALGIGGSLKPNGLMAGSVPVIIEAMERAQVRRLILVSAMGVGDRKSDAPPFMRLMIGVLLKDIYADKVIAEDAVRRSALDWTLVHPTMLTSGPKSGRYRVGERLALRGIPKISRADVADFLLHQLSDAAWIGKTVVISS
jgi:putative NADH-flavin reductase